MSESHEGSVERRVEEAARGRADHTFFTLHALVFVVIATVFAVIVAVALSLYLFL